MRAELLKNNILTGLLWEPESLSHLDPGAQVSFRGMVKAYRKLVYKDSKGAVAVGYCEKVSKLYEPFALYIKELFGDGIYFVHEDDDETYFLIINEGRVVSGTDCFISRELFDELIKHNEQYSHLDVTSFVDVQLDAVIERCRAHQLSLQRRRRFMIGLFFASGIVFLLVLALVLHFLVSK